MQEYWIIEYWKFSSSYMFPPAFLNIYPEICASDSDALLGTSHLHQKSCPGLMQNSVYTSGAIGKAARESKQQDFTQ